MTIFKKDIQCPGRHSNRGPPLYDLRALALGEGMNIIRGMLKIVCQQVTWRCLTLRCQHDVAFQCNTVQTAIWLAVTSLRTSGPEAFSWFWGFFCTFMYPFFQGNNISVYSLIIYISQDWKWCNEERGVFFIPYQIIAFNNRHLLLGKRAANKLHKQYRLCFPLGPCGVYLKTAYN
jgi:hypothetical protein